MAKTETQETQNTEIAARENGPVVTPSNRHSLQFRDWIRNEAEGNRGNRAVNVALSQLDRVLTATTFDEIMDADMEGTYGTQDLVDLEIEVHAGSVEYVPSDDKYEAGTLGVYVQFRATALMDFPARNIKSGSEILISSGAPLIVGKLRTLEANGFLPCPVKIIGVDAPSGTVLKLGKVPARASRA